MYDFIFYVIYNQQLQKAKSQKFARYNGSLIALVTFFFHIFLLLTIIKFFGNINITIFGLLLKENRFLEVGFLVVCLGVAYYFYNDKRIERISNKYVNSGNPTSRINYLKVILLMFVPLILFFVLARK